MKRKAFLVLVVFGVLVSPLLPGNGKGTWGRTVAGDYGDARPHHGLAGGYQETRPSQVFAGDYGEARQLPNVKALS